MLSETMARKMKPATMVRRPFRRKMIFPGFDVEVVLLIPINNAIRHQSTEDLGQAHEATPISGVDILLLFGVPLINVSFKTNRQNLFHTCEVKRPSGVDACLEDIEQEANCHCA